MLLYQYNTSSRDGAYPEYHITTTTPKLTYEHTHDSSLDRTFTIHPIILTHSPSTDHLMLSLHRTTLPFVIQRTHRGRKTYRMIHYISSHNGRLLALEHVRAFVRAFFHANIHKTACEFLHSHDIFVACDHATIVTGPLQGTKPSRVAVLLQVFSNRCTWRIAVEIQFFY